MKVYLTERTPPTLLTTESTITFPLDKTGKQFDSRLYTLALTDGKASPEEINKVLSELTTTLDPIVHECGPSQWCSGAVPFIFLVAFLWLLQYSPGELGLSHNTALVIGCVLFIGIFVSCKWCSIVVGGKSREVYAKMREECNVVIKKYNKEFVGRGLRWHMPEDFPEWVELWKDYKIEEFGGEKIEISEKDGEQEDLEKGSPRENVENVGDETQMELNGNQDSASWKNENGYIPIKLF